MGDRPIADTAAELDSVADVVRREIENVKSVVAQHADRTIRAVYPAQQNPRTPGLPDEIAAIARRMNTELDRVGEGIDSTIKAEIDQLNALLEHDGGAVRVSTAPAVPAPEPTMPAPRLSFVHRALEFHARLLDRILKRTTEPDLTEEATYTPAPCSMPGEVNADVAQQGQLGNCYFVAALCAVADRAPGLVRDSMRIEDGIVVITFPGRRFQLEQTLPVNSQTGYPIYARSPDMSTLVPFIEKAFAAHGGGYTQIGQGAPPGIALRWLTGRQASSVQPETADGSSLANALSHGHPTVASSVPLTHEHPRIDTARRYGLVEGCHAYAVKGLDAEGRVLLHNPWGTRHPQPIPMDDFRQLFTQVEWCEIP